MTISIIDCDYLINTLIDLVRIDSTNPSYTESGAGEGEIAHNALKSMRNIGMDVETLEPEPGRVNVLGILKGYGGGRSLMLNAHTDKLGIEGMDDPFSAEIHSGRMYDHDTQDMKGSLAACLTAAKTLVGPPFLHASKITGGTE